MQNSTLRCLYIFFFMILLKKKIKWPGKEMQIALFKMFNHFEVLFMSQILVRLQIMKSALLVTWNTHENCFKSLKGTCIKKHLLTVITWFLEQNPLPKCYLMLILKFSNKWNKLKHMLTLRIKSTNAYLFFDWGWRHYQYVHVYCQIA